MYIIKAFKKESDIGISQSILDFDFMNLRKEGEKA